MERSAATVQIFSSIETSSPANSQSLRMESSGLGMIRAVATSQILFVSANPDKDLPPLSSPQERTLFDTQEVNVQPRRPTGGSIRALPLHVVASNVSIDSQFFTAASRCPSSPIEFVISPMIDPKSENEFAQNIYFALMKNASGQPRSSTSTSGSVKVEKGSGGFLQKIKKIFDRKGKKQAIA
ncbi:uncharacterized protein SPPG_04037 [Spizellomyces punctatus DAOM BR117]|uniref:Uncharacterized protein n=1 Tax=Spizellomyces punctatus (strain DAOM BR117) TaxID=645134 RepID=A0A0L0HHJ5_SPIPD|nr:uncharacterized protein SPPG_04037 [Spizellomyces punctatus DAOM BR117]KND00936.1 hypothetical protein SPPG_04037 [Spizellomyces punctatus DAOM BR117]|eukprot:XP_016608975.1 hypothetical protein SPPG_04037 [Spizellomyces punctatus DAOM BR117]